MTDGPQQKHQDPTVDLPHTAEFDTSDLISNIPPLRAGDVTTLTEENEKLKIKVSHLEDIVQQITLELEQKKLVVEAAATSASRRSSLIAEKPSS